MTVTRVCIDDQGHSSPPILSYLLLIPPNPPYPSRIFPRIVLNPINPLYFLYMNHVKRYLPLFLCIVVVSLFIASLTFYPIEAEDIFSNIAYGGYFWEHKAIPTSEIFLFTGPFKTWAYDRMGSALIFYGGSMPRADLPAFLATPGALFPSPT